MFGICFLHCITQGGYLRPWLANIFLSCVDGFVFISGYYGIRFRPSKIIRLYAIALFCGVVVLAAGAYLGYYELSANRATVKLLRNAFLGPWFLNAYCLMMLLAPMVDAVLERVPSRLLPSVLVPFFLLTFGWSFGRGVPFLGSLLPDTAGLGSYTGLTLLSVYVVARLCHRFEVERMLTWRRIVGLLTALWCVTAIGFGDYASPFAVALSAVMFYVFRRLRWPSWMGRMAIGLGPSMFSVYLLHSNRVGFGLIQNMERALVNGREWSVYSVYPVVALTVFLLCVLADFPRRLIVGLTKRLWSRALTWLDECWLRIVPER